MPSWDDFKRARHRYDNLTTRRAFPFLGDALNRVSANATLVSTDVANGSSVAAVYSVPAPMADGTYTISANASSVTFETTITLNDDGSWTYDETTMLRMTEFPDLLPHVDHNTLHKVA